MNWRGLSFGVALSVFGIDGDLIMLALVVGGRSSC